MKHTTIAVDLAKSIFQISVSDRPGHVASSHRVSRGRFLRFFAQRPAATVVFEACGSAHYWARHLEKLGHQVVLLPPYDVRPYVRRNKTDRADAKGLLEAFRNEAIHPVPIKSVSHHGIAALHRLRSAWLATRTSRINTVRGVLRELGLTIPVGARHVVPRVESLANSSDAELPDVIRPFPIEACGEIRAGERGDCNRRRLNLGLTPLRRNDDLLDSSPFLFFRWCLELLSAGDRCGSQEAGCRQQEKPARNLHCVPFATLQLDTLTRLGISSQRKSSGTGRLRQDWALRPFRSQQTAARSAPRLLAARATSASPGT